MQNRLADRSQWHVDSSFSMAHGQLVFNGVAIDIAFSFCYIVGDKFGKELTDGAEDKDK